MISTSRLIWCNGRDFHSGFLSFPRIVHISCHPQQRFPYLTAKAVNLMMNFKPDRKRGPCLSRLVEETFWEGWGFGVLLRLHCVGSYSSASAQGQPCSLLSTRTAITYLSRKWPPTRFICCC